MNVTASRTDEHTFYLASKLVQQPLIQYAHTIIIRNLYALHVIPVTTLKEKVHPQTLKIRTDNYFPKTHTVQDAPVLSVPNQPLLVMSRKP